MQSRAVLNAVRSHKGPITLLGFSFGAEVVLRTAISCPSSGIDRVIAHSPGKGVLKNNNGFGPSNCYYTFIATNGDILCEAETKSLYSKFSANRSAILQSFDYIPESGGTLIDNFMRKNNHQFINAIPYLESINWHMA